MNFRRKDIDYVEGDAIPPSNATKRTVEQFAENVAELAGFQNGDDPAEIVDRLGGRIRFQSLDDWLEEHGSIFVHAESDFDIVLPHFTSPVRDRFTVAHELGHYFVHSDQGEVPLVAYRKGTGRLEWEANWFAAGLLMPRDEFREVAAEFGDSELADHFGVSVDAVLVRKDALGIQ